MKYLVRILLVLLFVPIMMLWAIGALISLWISAFQIPIIFIWQGHVYVEYLLLDWYFENALNPLVYIEKKLKEKNLM